MTSFTYSDLDGNGWTRKNGCLEIVWEEEEHLRKAKERIDYVLNGCKCKTGCGTNRCKCRKGGKKCGPGCQCMSCANLGAEGVRDEEVHEMEIEGQEDIDEEEAYITDEDETSYSAEYEDEELDNIMTMVFGEEEDDEN